MEEIFNLMRQAEKRMDDDYEISLMLKTFREDSRLSPFVGRKIIMDLYEHDPEDSVFNAVIVGYVKPQWPESWGINEHSLITNHPKWGNNWVTSIDIPDTDGALPSVYKTPTKEDDMATLASKLDRYSDIDGVEDVSERLTTISEEVHDLKIAASNFDGPEVGWYMAMAMSPDLTDGQWFHPLIISDVFGYVAKNHQDSQRYGYGRCNFPTGQVVFP